MLQNFSSAILSKRIKRNHTSEYEMKILNEHHFITNIPAGESGKQK